MKAKISDRVISSLEVNPLKAYEVCDESLKGFRLVVRPSGTLTFVYCYRNQKGRWLRYTIGKHGTVTCSQARSIAKDLAADVRKGKDIQAEKKQIRQEDSIKRRKTLRYFFDEKYKPYLISNKKTGAKIAQQLESEFINTWSSKPLSEISPWIMEKWRKEKLKTVKPGTSNRLLMHFKAMMNKAVEWEVLAFNPISNVKQLKEDRSGVVRYLTPDEETRLRQALDSRQDRKKAERQSYIKWCKARGLSYPEDNSLKIFTDYLKPLVIVALNTGMRRGELFSLAFADLDFHKRVITVQGYNAKSGSTRHIPMNDEVYDVLRRWCDINATDSLVFQNSKTGERFDNIGKSWSNLLKEANIEGFRFHDLRHTFASKLVMKGVDLYTVKELLGHSCVFRPIVNSYSGST